MHALKLGIGATRWASSEIIARKTYVRARHAAVYTCLIIVSSSMKTNDFGHPLDPGSGSLQIVAERVRAGRPGSEINE
jgi:hypothetical protein